MALQRMRSPCTSSGKWRDETTSRPEVGRTFWPSGTRSGVEGVLLPKVGFTETGSTQFMLVPEVWRKKSWPHLSKTTPHGFGMLSCAVRSRWRALRAVAEEAAIDAAHGAVRRLDIRVQKHALAQHERAARVGGVGADRVVRVVRVEAAEHDLHACRPCRRRSCRGAARDSAPARHRRPRAQTRSRWADAACRRRPFPCRLCRRRSCLRRSGSCRSASRRRAGSADRSASPRPRAGPCCRRKAASGSRDSGTPSRSANSSTLYPGGTVERLHRLLAVEILLAPGLYARLVVRRHRRERVRLAVVHGEVLLFAGGDIVDERVAQRRHLARLLHLVGIILRAEGIVALPVRVDAVEEVVVVVPKPILLLHRRVDAAPDRPSTCATDAR